MPGSRSLVRGVLSLLPAALLLPACELAETALTQPEDLLVAEVYVMVGDGEYEATAFLHATLGSELGPQLPSASVRFLVDDTLVLPLVHENAGQCLGWNLEGEVDGECYVGPPDLVEEAFHPGSHVEVEILLPDGRGLWGSTVLPNDVNLLQPRIQSVCALPPGRTMDLVWSRSPGAWAYAAETAIWGLRAALEPQGIEMEADTVALIGLAVSDADTTIVFPREFGVFDRFELAREVALALQEGLPEGTVANVSVAALDRNYVNWVRGGNFNPSGAVRVPSLRGDGTGVIGSVVRRSIRVIGTNPNSLFKSCLEGG